MPTHIWFSVCLRLLTMEWGAKENRIAVIALHTYISVKKAQMKFMSFSKKLIFQNLLFTAL